MWYLQHLNPQDTSHHMTTAVRIGGDVAVEALQQAFHTLVARHEILRTAFVLEGDHLVQWMQEPGDHGFRLEVGDFLGDAPDGYIRDLASRPFNLAEGPLMRATLLQSEAGASGTVLVIVMHHVISDEWSMGLFWRELSAAYTAHKNGVPVDLPPLSVQYGDFAWWQRQQFADGQHTAQMAYWRETLAGELPLLQLPIDRLRPRVQRHRGAFIQRELSSGLTAALQQIAKDARTTLFVMMLAAYQAFLYRQTQQTDILVGTPATNRDQQQTESLIGFFLNTIVFRADLSEAQRFSDLLATTRGQSMQALANQAVPFEQIVSDLNPPRDPGYHPIFQTMFVYQDGAAHQQTLGDLSLTPITVDAGISKFDLTLFTKLAGDTLELSMEYDTDLFHDETAHRLLDHFETFLHSIAAAPSQSITTLNMLPDAERDMLLNQWTQTQAAFPAETLTHDLISNHPTDVIAVRHGDEMLTYGELDACANRVAQYLLQNGVQPGTFVGLCVERSLEMVVGIVGILKAGCAYVPVDPAYPEERIAFLLRDAAMPLLLTQTHLLGALAAHNIPCVPLDDAALFADMPATLPDVDVTPDDLAYMIYTSGSTGQPKGVRVTHRNLVHSTTARFTVYPHAAERFLLLSSFAFDSSITGIFWSLCQGGTLCLPPHYAERDVMQIAVLIAQYGVTHMLLLPSLYQILLEFAEPAQLATLNTIMVAGETCPLTLPAQHYATVPGATLYNEYGPTEGTVWSTVWEIPPQPEKMLIGKAIPNMVTYILDAQLQPVPVGVVGELYIGGEGITQGYHNRPELTAERFLPDPFGSGTIYRTGDLARYRPDGNIEFLGRMDNQVKISGHRIELSEIENALLTHPQVSEAAVLVVEQPVSAEKPAAVSDEMLLAALAAHPDGQALLDEIEGMSDEAVQALLEQYR
ncbi:MAG: amino acid adenylation domain-containing protein [Chloroflexota bacterium]